MAPRGLRRAPLLAAAMLTMVWSVWVGLVRMGWVLPVPASDQLLLHGPLFVGGFFGTLIALERAVALGTVWAYAGPFLTAAGAALLVAGATQPGAIGLASGSAVLLGASTLVVRRQPTMFALTMAIGAAAWLAGNVQWLAGAPVYQVVYWWVGFLVLTIAAERLELNRLLRPARGVRAWFALAVAILVTGIVLTSFAYDLGARLAGAGLVLLAGWLFRHDLARRTVRQHGLTRYMAVSLLAGYAWLGAGGVMAVVFGGVTAGPRYDALLHAVLLGFVMSMVFAHAPIVFPAVLGVSLPYRPSFYAHLALLHFSVAVRVAGALVPGAYALRAWGGLLNAAAILVFVLATVRSALLARRGA
jgi:hypothetical protein